MVNFKTEYFAKLVKMLKNIKWKDKATLCLINAKKHVLQFIDICKKWSLTGKKIKWQHVPAELYGRIKKIKFQKTSFYRFLKKALKKLSDSWKIVLTVIPLFLLFYYGIGSRIVESIDVKTEYKLERNDKTPLFKTADVMAFLIKREVDDKMWTPNLPMIFPAYVLDNMPNFQTGIIQAVRDIVGTMRYFKYNTDSQNKDIRKAHDLLIYPPDVWIMSKKGKFNLAPSSNSQYRKAGNELRKFMRDGIYKPNSDDLRLVLKKISAKLKKLTLDGEDYQQENSAKWFDFKADDIFYNHKGYAFALWQISKVLCRDFKDIIVKNDLYEDWIRMSASLQKAAEYSPSIIRNGKDDSVFTPNHILMQNYYLLRAVSAAEKIRGNLSEIADAD